MPKSKSKSAIKNLPVANLAYAVGRLVAAGKTTEAEVLRLAGERGPRIVALQAELDALLRGGTPAPKAVAAATRVPAKATKAAKAAPKATMSAKQAAARKIQGHYLGYLRGFVGAKRARIMAIGKKSGIPAAVAEMLRLRGMRAAPVQKAPAARKAAPAKKRLAPSPARKAQLKVHGTYIGMMRSLSVAEKAKIKAIAAGKGMKAAVALMKKNASAK